MVKIKYNLAILKEFIIDFIKFFFYIILFIDFCILFIAVFIYNDFLCGIFELKYEEKYSKKNFFNIQ